MYVIPGGESIGLQLSTGVYVTGRYEVETKDGKVSPWKDSGIRVNDKIVKVNNKSINTITDLKNVLSETQENQLVNIVVERSGNNVNLVTKAVLTKDNKMSLGLYIKDKILGVGTITYINDSDSTYGALGHGVVNRYIVDQNLGNITKSSIKGIRKAVPGNPGEKKATILDYSIGDISVNSNIGIFGKLKDVKVFSSTKKLEVALRHEVKLGKAEIWTVLDNDVKERFEIEIVEIAKQDTTGIKGMKIKITDPRLIEKTGGIIQGMSGSPIIQNNKLVGAVSHVVVDNPLYGYGVFAQWMLNIK